LAVTSPPNHSLHPTAPACCLALLDLFLAQPDAIAHRRAIIMSLAKEGIGVGILNRLWGGGAGPPILVRDPARPADVPDPVLADLIRQHLRGDEIIDSWREHPPGEVAVTVVSQRVRRQCADGRLGGGAGRSLHFGYRDGQWAFHGEGCWRS
jgi:hypothetical protein